MNVRPLLSLFAAATCAAPVATQITMTEIATVDLGPTSSSGGANYIGTNPVAVAWNGSRLWVAGYNNDNPNNPPQNCAIVEVLNPTGSNPTFGTPFGVVSTPGFRGYSGLDVSGSTLAAAYDDGGSNAQGIAAYDFAGNQLWTRTARGGSGVAFDPGFPGGNPALGSGVAWTTFGSGRRALQDATTGADVWTTSDGMVILTSAGTFWRDMDFDDTTGDVYLREGNNVIRWTRTGDNAVTNGQLIFDPVDADSVAQQNLTVVPTVFGPIVIFNDRQTTTAPQDFFAQVQAMLADGTSLTLDFGSFAPSTGNGAYDFSYDAATGTLAILDFTNRNAHLFQVDVPSWLEYGQGCNSSSGQPVDFSLSGSAAPGNTLGFDFAGGPSGSTAFVIFGITEGSTPLPNSSCEILVSPLLDLTLGPIFLDGQGAGSTTVNVPGSARPRPFTVQGVVVDLASGNNPPVVTTSGYRLSLQ